MGSNTSISYNESRGITTQILQESNQSCSITCNNNLNNGTFIFQNVTGNITIAQSCSISDVSCAFKTSFEANLQTLVQSMIQQQSTAMSGFSLDYTNVKERININTVIQNSISQIMNSSCAISANNSANNTYFYVDNLKGNFNMSQNGSISSSSCTVDNFAKATSYTKTTSDASQKSTIISIFSLIFIAFIVLIIVLGIVASVFILSGGVGQVANAASQMQKGQGGGAGGFDLGSLSKMMEK